MRADEVLKYRVYWESVFWQRGKIRMTIMLNTGRQDEDWNENDRFDSHCRKTNTGEDRFCGEQGACRCFSGQKM